MQTPLKFLTALILTASAFSASAHGMHKHKPLTFEELPQNLPTILHARGELLQKGGRQIRFSTQQYKIPVSIPACRRFNAA